MAYHAETQARYNETQKGKARRLRWLENMSEEQKEKVLLAKREYIARKRKEKKLERLADGSKQTGC